MYNYGFQQVSTENVSTSTTSAQSAALGSAEDATFWVRLCANTDVHYAVGSNPTATTSSTFLPEDTIEIIKCSYSDKIGVRTTAGTGLLSVTQLSSQCLGNPGLMGMFMLSELGEKDQVVMRSRIQNVYRRKKKLEVKVK